MLPVGLATPLQTFRRFGTGRRTAMNVTAAIFHRRSLAWFAIKFAPRAAPLGLRWRPKAARYHSFREVHWSFSIDPPSLHLLIAQAQAYLAEATGHP